ncbi:hypothetical protein GCM10010522_19470 [Kribbella solani]
MLGERRLHVGVREEPPLLRPHHPTNSHHSGCRLRLHVPTTPHHDHSRHHSHHQHPSHNHRHHPHPPPPSTKRPTTGRLRATAGRLRATAGRLRATAGRLRATAGRLRATAGRLRATGCLRPTTGCLRVGWALTPFISALCMRLGECGAARLTLSVTCPQCDGRSGPLGFSGFGGFLGGFGSELRTDYAFDQDRYVVADRIALEGVLGGADRGFDVFGSM